MAELPDAAFQSVRTFTKTVHHSVPSHIDLQYDNRLPHGFSVCIIGASAGIGRHIAYAYARARSSVITIASRHTDNLVPVAAYISDICPSTKVFTQACDISSASSVASLASHISSFCPEGLDCLITVPASSPPFSKDVTHDSAEDNTEAFLTNTLGLFHAAQHFIPFLLRKVHGAKALIAVSSIGAFLTQGFAAQPAYNISKLAETRLVEYLANQFKEQGLFALAVHPGSVLTEMSKRHCPREFWSLLEDEVGLCGVVCVWVTKRVAMGEDILNANGNGGEDITWLSGRFLSANWDLQELVERKEEIVKEGKLKIGLLV
jgi:NAD(P)-dependent dehydrogenase (short-subunit alcohol dehydrogenase family)